MKKMITLLTLAFSLSAMASSDYACGGTEPFWNMKLEGDKITFNAMMEDQYSTTRDVLARTDAAGMSADFAFVVKARNMNATIITGECNDGMSDIVYSKHIVLTFGETVLYGCCNPIKK